MNIEIKCFIIPHNEEPYYTCADRYAVEPSLRAIAVADGVGGSMYPSFLSERITTDFVNNPATLFNNDLLLTKDYSEEFDRYYEHRYSELPPTKQLVLDLKSEQTRVSSCTFVGCYLEKNCWKYYALGDSYLFFIANDGTLRKFSSMDGREFDVFPEYFSTDGKHNGKLISGEIPLEDGVLLLMTDALSDWFIKYYEEDHTLLNRLMAVNSHQEYKDLCNNELAMGRLHDDDCALIICKVENTTNPDVSFSIKHMDDISDLSLRDLRKLYDEEETARKSIEKECKLVSNDNKELKKEKENLENEKSKIQQELINTQKALETEKNNREKEREENKKIIDQLRNKNSKPVDSPIVVELSSKLDDIKKTTGIVLQEIRDKINTEKTEDLSLNPIHQALQKIKEDINSLLQCIGTKNEENGNTSNEDGSNEEVKPEVDSSEEHDGSKKKLIHFLNYIKCNPNLVLWILIILLFLIIIFNKTIIIL